ncbi:alpha-amylase family glycosyl hydrolase [Vibrio sp. Of7-15]|uniref:alpha-amylase family glycosyl hydrolase n=1 Tax=Vibrio sp. Of7-15 TaxID=2724879 RepID=UPI001EF1CE15|nr:alpha-amylase family glycosyl hydrolase [Vibrio sp. Of7-15]MCG7496654.1 alpha-amylase family glycosyl hydrolase [Vibrio sp. Of7-15]
MNNLHNDQKCSSTNVILHAFDWRYEEVSQQAEKISTLGYRSVLVSPPQKSMKKEGETKWWQRYQPQDYRVIDNQLGNTSDFTAMVAALAAVGIRTYVDIVFNHMANESAVRDDLTYPCSTSLAEYQANRSYFEQQKLFGDLSQPLFTSDDFVEAFGIKDWKDKWQVQNGRITGGPHDPGLPTLRSSPYVIKQQQQYIQALKDLGVKGFRIDAAKHMSIEHIQQVWTDDLAQGVHIFGEIITDGGVSKEEYQLFLQPYLEQTSLAAYDFPLFHTLYDTFQNNQSIRALINPYCYGEALAKSRAITFAITHDIPNNDVFLPLVMSEVNEHLTHVYVLGRDGGVPLIYSDKNTSNTLSANQQPRWQDAWQSKPLQNMIRFHNAVHGTRMQNVLATDEQLAFYRGDKGIVAINNANEAAVLTIPVLSGHQNAKFIDTLTDHSFTVKNATINVKLQAKSAAMILIHK